MSAGCGSWGVHPALNFERAREDAAGQVRWLQPDYQIPRFAKGAAAKSGELNPGETVVVLDSGLPAFPKDPYEQAVAVEAVLLAAGRPIDAAEPARSFKGRAKAIEQWMVKVMESRVRYGRARALAGGKFAARRMA
ncbi:MAG: hypothetical protein QE280_01530 [Caulobacter sp.]|nr:hypothetical protein [Caulobacter sp.]